MDPLISNGGSVVGNATLIGGWITGGVAILLQVWAVFERGPPWGWDDTLQLLATFVAVGLAAQTTWAVVDEGQGQYLLDETPTEAEKVIKVYELCRPE